MKKIKLDTLLTYLLMLLILMCMLLEFNVISSFSAEIRFSLVFFILFVLFLIYYKRPYIDLKALYIFIPAILFQSLYIVNISEYTTEQSTFSIFFQGFFFIFAFTIASLDWTKRHIKILGNIYFIVIPIILIILFTNAYELNTNQVGAYVFFFSFFPLLYYLHFDRKINIRLLFVIILSLSIIYFSETRSVFLSVAFILLTWFFWKIITKNRFLFNIYLTLVFSFIYAVTVIYPKLNEIWDNFYYYNQQFILLTGKSIYSGRDVIWSLLIDLISTKPLLGFGSGTLVSHFMNTDLSAHNLYLQISLQSGFIGLFLFAIFIYFIWNTFWLDKNDIKIKLISCFMIGILIHQIFEVSMTQNSFGLPILQWLIIGLGLSFALNKRPVMKCPPKVEP